MIGVLMNEQEKPDKKRPIDMTTDEAIDHVFAPEIAEELRKQAGKDEPYESDEGDLTS